MAFFSNPQTLDLDQVYAAKDTAVRAQDERENLAATSSQREAEDADAQVSTLHPPATRSELYRGFR